jgi:hypothetical protein
MTEVPSSLAAALARCREHKDIMNVATRADRSHALGIPSCTLQGTSALCRPVLGAVEAGAKRQIRLHNAGVTAEFIRPSGDTFVVVLDHCIENNLSLVPRTAGEAVHWARQEQHCVIITARQEDDTTSTNSLFPAVARAGAAYNWIAPPPKPLPAPPQCTVVEVAQDTPSILKSQSRTRRNRTPTPKKYKLESVGRYVSTFCKEEFGGIDAALVCDVFDTKTDQEDLPCLGHTLNSEDMQAQNMVFEQHGFVHSEIIWKVGNVDFQNQRWSNRDYKDDKPQTCEQVNVFLAHLKRENDDRFFTENGFAQLMLDDIPNAYTDESDNEVVPKKERWHGEQYEPASRFPRHMMHSVIHKKLQSAKLQSETLQGAPQHAPGSLL